MTNPRNPPKRMRGFIDSSAGCPTNQTSDIGSTGTPGAIVEVIVTFVM